MSSRRIPSTFLALAAAVALLAPVEAAARGRLVHVRAPSGGYVAGRDVDREPGSATVTRGWRTDRGHGVEATRTTDWGDGAVETSRNRRYANGATEASRSSVVRHADGSISRARSHTGVAGNSQSRWGTIERTEDGYARRHGASTSGGRGYTASRDVSIGDDQIRIDRQLTTNSGHSLTSSRSYPRPGHRRRD